MNQAPPISEFLVEHVFFDDFQRSAAEAGPSSLAPSQQTFAWQTSDWGLEPNSFNVSGLPGHNRSGDGGWGMVKEEADAGGRDAGEVIENRHTRTW